MRRAFFFAAIFGAALWPSAPLTAATSFYASPTGSGTVCSIVAPCSLAYTIGATSPARPGDTIWLRGGTYNGLFRPVLNGTSSLPIIVRQYPGERATIDGGSNIGSAILTVGGSYTWFWGLEVMSSYGSRTSTQTSSWPTDIFYAPGVGSTNSGVVGSNPGLKFINMIVHDTTQGFSLWKEATDTEVYGNLIYYNGWSAPDRTHGHGIYTQNQTGTKTIKDNLFFGNFSHGIHMYGSAIAFLNNFYLQGNAIFGNLDRNFLLGGGVIAENPTVASNYFYRPVQPINGRRNTDVSMGYYAGAAQGCTNATFTNNYIADTTTFTGCAAGLTMTGNTFYGVTSGFLSQSYPSNTYFAESARPTVNQVFIRPNQYEPGRANVIVFNWSLASTVSVNLTGVLSVGQSYQVRNAQNFYGAPVLTGTYAGGSVTLPMTGLTAATPRGWPKPAETGPEFAAFVVLPAASVGTLTPTPPLPTATPTRTPTPTATATPTQTPTWTDQVRDQKIKKLEGVVYTPTPGP